MFPRAAHFGWQRGFHGYTLAPHLRHESQDQKPAPEVLNATLARSKGPVSKFLARHYRHFNSASLLDAAKAYDAHLKAGARCW